MVTGVNLDMALGKVGCGGEYLLIIFNGLLLAGYVSIL